MTGYISSEFTLPRLALVVPHKFHLRGSSFFQADSRLSKDSRARVD